MEYRTGKIGRVFAVRFDDNEDFLAGLSELIKKEAIKTGWFQVIGGLRQAGVVTGPKAPTMPPEPVWAEMNGAHEVLASGSIFWSDTDTPRIHLHAALGHHGETVTACVRKGTKTYLILEVIIFEITGINASRPWFAEGEFFKLGFD